MDRQLVREVTAFRNFDGIDLADQVGDGDVGRGELFAVAAIARQPADGQVIAAFGQEGATVPADRLERIIVDLAAADHG